MISIHTGGGFLHRTEGTGVYYYTPLKTNGGPAATPADEDAGQLWSQAQKRHKHASISLADSMQTALTGNAAGKSRKIQGAPLKVLEGADLPAVLVEVGTITHPATEMNLSSDQGID
ncbi:MAG: N-acetylmuramoyl-L-alanine amidase, partial [Desulfobacteraceae bacterium]